MTTIFSDALKQAGLAPRADLVDALNSTWRRLGEPGEWLTGPQRLAVAQAARESWECPGCDARKKALSPYAPAPAHINSTDLDPAWIDVIHFTVRDSGRMTSRVFEEAIEAGMLEDEFVEVISVAIETQAMDGYAFGVGLPKLPLPAPIDGAPPRERTEIAKMGPGWIPTVAPEDASPAFSDWYDNGYHFYIRRATTLLPRETRRYWELTRAFYLEDPRMHELDGLDRAITRAQTEFLAARASALLGCYY